MTVQSDSDPLSPGVAPAALLRAARDVHVVELGPNRASFPLAGPDTAGAYSLSDFTMAAPPAPSPPPHVHEDADECVYVLEGTLEMGVGEDRLTGGPGSLMRAPRGTPHSLVNAGPGPARFIVVLSPPGFEGFWREMADLRARIGGPPDPETVVALQHTYHMSTGGEARRFQTAQARVAMPARDANEPADRLLRVGDVDQQRP